ncbi:hypothetical protein [Bacillus pseudomycoides]|nr:hypothetical protein [Bacillus pseudomycoides]
MFKDTCKRKEMKVCASQRKSQYEVERVAFIKLAKERTLLVGPFDV